MKNQLIITSENQGKFILDLFNDILYKEKNNNLIPVFNDIKVKEIKTHKFSAFKKSQFPSVLKISLGLNCNFNCVYCMQKGDKTKSSKDLTNFKSVLSEKLKFNRLKRIELWGGEPSLYLNEIHQILEFFNSQETDLVEPTEIFITSNGSLFKKEIIEEFLKYENLKFAFSFSHDGVKQKELRGKCLLEENIEGLKFIDDSERCMASISLVITNDNYDLMENYLFFEEFRKKYSLKKFSLIEQLLKNNGIDSAKYLLNEEQQKVFIESVKKAIDYHFELKKNSNKIIPPGRLNCVDTIYSLFRGLVQENKEKFQSLTTCGLEDYITLIVDLNGEILSCVHHQDKLNFNLKDFSNQYEFNMEEKINLRKRKECLECPIEAWCKGLCPLRNLNNEDETFNLECSLTKKYIKVILEKAFQKILKIDDAVIELN